LAAAAVVPVLLATELWMDLELAAAVALTWHLDIQFQERFQLLLVLVVWVALQVQLLLVAKACEVAAPTLVLLARAAEEAAVAARRQVTILHVMRVHSNMVVRAQLVVVVVVHRTIEMHTTLDWLVQEVMQSSVRLHLLHKQVFVVATTTMAARVQRVTAARVVVQEVQLTSILSATALCLLSMEQAPSTVVVVVRLA
jgi:hypothetical protein